MNFNPPPHGVDIPSAGVPQLNVMRCGSSKILDINMLDMDDRFLGTTAVCFVFNFCLLCSRTLPVSERNLPVPKPFFR